MVRVRRKVRQSGYVVRVGVHADSGRGTDVTVSRTAEAIVTFETNEPRVIVTVGLDTEDRHEQDTMRPNSDTAEVVDMVLYRDWCGRAVGRSTNVPTKRREFESVAHTLYKRVHTKSEKA